MFRQSSLGFRVSNDIARGVVVVREIAGLPPKEFDGRIQIGDVIVAVNGAPLGWINHQKALAQRIRGLGRPLRLTFWRDPAQNVPEESRSEQDGASASEADEAQDAGSVITLND